MDGAELQNRLFQDGGSALGLLLGAPGAGL